jgi:hypothetical protein
MKCQVTFFFIFYLPRHCQHVCPRQSNRLRNVFQRFQKKVSRRKEVFRKINCRKLTNKVVNRNFLLFVNKKRNSLICHAWRKKSRKEKITGRCFSNRKLLDNLVIIEMVISSFQSIVIPFLPSIMKRYFLIHT